MSPLLASGGLGITAELGLQTWLLITALFFLSFFFSGTETSLFSLQKLDRHELAKEGRSGQLVANLLDRGRRPLLSTILMGNETVNVALTAVSAAVLIQLVPDKPWLNIVLLPPSMILISEITPKVLAIRHPRRWARVAIWPLTAFYRVVTPIRSMFTVSIDLLARLFGAQSEVQHKGLEEQELMVLVDRGTASGAIDPAERDIIEAVLDFDELIVERLMTPRPDLLGLGIDTPWQELLDQTKASGYSRIPIWDTAPDDIIGVLLIKDLLRFQDNPPTPQQLRTLLLPPAFVPASKPADVMLQEFLKRQLHMAFVVDEHGTLVGVLTLDDHLEELLGKLDESEENELTRPRPNVLSVIANMDVEDFTEESGILLPTGEWHTVGGFVFHELGRLPRTGDVVRWQRWTFSVAQMSGRRIVSLEIVEHASITPKATS